MTVPTTRLLARSTSKLASVSIQPSQQFRRAFSQTCFRRNDEADPFAEMMKSSDPQKPSPAPPHSSPNPGPRQLDRQQPMRSSFREMLDSGANRQPSPTPYSSSPEIVPQTDNSDVQRVFMNRTMSQAMGPNSTVGNEPEGEDWGPSYEPFHFHIYSHKHNTHVTVTKPNRNPILSMSAGNLGFKKSRRGTYDAAYQLCAHVLDKLNQGGWHRKISALEVVLRGFGSGREAATKVLLGNEGRLLRPFINRVSDDTKLKFGGTRSPKPRRLG
ncbi:hypothetical protein GGR50DRAFT_239691 [Xylaria sp. CBS 124048]|nr:hypothetical protein GGR50DRAFT_239691 [Xylaria sp. CBS 124048]